jgi:hypothetical protein
MLPRIAWIMAGATVVLVVLDVLVSAQALPLWSETAVAVHGFPFVHGAVIGSSVMGALIISRYERHPIGWLLLLVGTTSSLSLLAEAYAYWVQESDGPDTENLAGVAAWVASLLGGQLAIAGLALMFLLSPDGHLLSRRWRYAAWAIGIGALLCVVAVLTLDPTTFRLYMRSDDVGLVRNLMLSVGFLTISGGLVAAVGSMLKRLRHSTGVQRQQLRLIALSAALIVAGIVILLVVQAANGGDQTWLAGLPLNFAYFLLPILLATAVLRHQLYELDVIINRSLVLVAGTVFAALGYIGLVVTVGQFVEGRAGGFWLALLGIALVAIAFQPLRRSVVRLANRVAYGSRAQPYEALTDFSRRLAEAPSPGTLLPAIAEAAARSVSAGGATTTLGVPGSDSVAATWGTVQDPPDHSVPVRTEDRTLGRIDVTLARGRPLRPADLRLLDALAEQTAVAFGNTSLAGQLADHVAELDRTTKELARSRLRLVEAEDAARRTLEAAISREVLPFLAVLPEEIHRAHDAVRTGASEHGIDHLVEDTNSALESLRELTRGVFPTQLARAGLGPALRSLVTRSSVPATLDLDGAVGRRFSPRVETAIYFCCVEAARAGAGLSSIELSVVADALVLRLTGDSESGIDLQSVIDRAEAAGGSLRTGEGFLELSIPVEPEPPSLPVGGPGPGL